MGTVYQKLILFEVGGLIKYAENVLQFIKTDYSVHANIKSKVTRPLYVLLTSKGHTK